MARTIEERVEVLENCIEELCRELRGLDEGVEDEDVRELLDVLLRVLEPATS